MYTKSKWLKTKWAKSNEVSMQSVTDGMVGPMTQKQKRPVYPLFLLSYSDCNLIQSEELILIYAKAVKTKYSPVHMCVQAIVGRQIMATIIQDKDGQIRAVGRNRSTSSSGDLKWVDKNDYNDRHED